jgi:hypothetical protein
MDHMHATCALLSMQAGACVPGSMTYAPPGEAVLLRCGCDIRTRHADGNQGYSHDATQVAAITWRVNGDDGGMPGGASGGPVG